ncbi:MAG TPA: hypothetical protein VHM70_28420 [Polyangiaceae bacterium]|nr:hypothetical protein [Polyangiaceae bacterium]
MTRLACGEPTVRTNYAGFAYDSDGHNVEAVVGGVGREGWTSAFGICLERASETARLHGVVGAAVDIAEGAGRAYCRKAMASGEEFVARAGCGQASADVVGGVARGEGFDGERVT